MSKQPTHSIIYKARSYQDQDGQTKNVYGTIGAAWPDKDGNLSMIRLDTIPVSWDGTLYLREPTEDQKAAQ